MNADLPATSLSQLSGVSSRAAIASIDVTANIGDSDGLRALLTCRRGDVARLFLLISAHFI